MSVSAYLSLPRVMPFRVRPLPDEPFDSWLEKSAATMRATIRETASALGLLTIGPDGIESATRWMANAWATELSDEDALRLERSTGIAAAEFHNMTRMRFARAAIRYTRSGRVSSFCAVGGIAGRYCPDCLIDSGGRWRMSWQFSFGFACLRHRRLLVDVCPGCGQTPRRVGHPLALVPVPGRCHNPLGGIRGPNAHLCRADLTSNTATIAANPETLSAQRQMMRVLSAGQAGFGIYARAPQPAVRVFEDIRLLSRIALHAIAADDITDPVGMHPELRPRLDRAGKESVGVAAGNSVAVSALEDPQDVVKLIKGRVGASTSYPLCTPQLQALIAASLGRTRRPTAFLQSAPASELDPAERARKIPAQIWPEWMRRWGPTPARGTYQISREITVTALSAALVFAGTRLTHSAALALIDPCAPAAHVTYVMRVLAGSDQETTTIDALLRLNAYLDTHDVAIDYARRRALDCRDLLTEDSWNEICHVLNIVPGGGTRWRHARALLYRDLTGNAVRQIDAKLNSAEVDRFGHTLPANVRHELDRTGRLFLDLRGIDEPLTWTPPFDESLETGAEEAARMWSPARPAFAVAGQTVAFEEIAVAYAAGATTYELAEMTGVSRQTISRILAEAAMPTRRGRPNALDIDVERVRHLYEVEHKTMEQIAAIMGCSQGTICRRLRVPHPRLRQQG